MSTTEAAVKNLPPLRELYIRREQLEKDLDILSQSFGKLKEAQDLFVQNIATLTSLKSIATGTETMLPLTNSVYTMGRLADNKKVMIDIGTGYFVEKELADADEYYVRKIKFLQEQLNTLGQVIGEKRETYQVMCQAIKLKAASAGQ